MFCILMSVGLSVLVVEFFSFWLAAGALFLGGYMWSVLYRAIYNYYAII